MRRAPRKGLWLRLFSAVDESLARIGNVEWATRDANDHFGVNWAFLVGRELELDVFNLFAVGSKVALKVEEELPGSVRVAKGHSAEVWSYRSPERLKQVEYLTIPLAQVRR